MNAVARSPETVRVLEKLLVICAEGARRYRHAADAVKEPTLHRVLARGAARREEIVSVLTNALVELDREPTHHRSVAGAVHCEGLDALVIPSAQDERAVLHECARGERATLAAFASALGRSLPDEIHDVIQAQLGRVLETSSALRYAQRSLDQRDTKDAG